MDNATDVYPSAPDAPAIVLEAEITVNPREGAGSSVADKVEFYKESDGGTRSTSGTAPSWPGSEPSRYELAIDADRHGAIGEVRTYFANCVARSTQDATRKVPSYSRPVRVGRD